VFGRVEGGTWARRKVFTCCFEGGFVVVELALFDVGVGVVEPDRFGWGGRRCIAAIASRDSGLNTSKVASVLYRVTR
jgi:hypothetical protein